MEKIINFVTKLEINRHIYKEVKVMQNMEQIYEEYFETVNKYLFCLTRNSDISEELTQETFYRAVKKIDTYKGEWNAE